MNRSARKDPMPLEIAYRPVILPPHLVRDAAGITAPGEITSSDSLSLAPQQDQRQPLPLADPFAPREFTARIRTRDVVSVRRMLNRASIWRQRLGGVAAIGALALVLGVIGWGNPGGIDAAAAHERIAGLQPFEQPGDSFPGSAFYYLSPQDTGLLSPDAAEAAWKRNLATIHGDDAPAPVPDASGAFDNPTARPLFLRGSGQDQWRALQCLTAAIYYEAASEPDGGQRAVAQVVLNRVSHPAFPKTVCGVVYQGSERPGCQFSFACDGALARAPVRQFWDRARRVAEQALAGFVYAPVGLATHYHTTAVHPYWADSLRFVGTIGAHRFYSWTGRAGRADSFAVAYSGGEPLAAPHPRTWTPAIADIADPVALEQAFEAGRIAALRQTQASGSPSSTLMSGAAFGQQPLPHAVGPAYAPQWQQRGGDAALRAPASPEAAKSGSGAPLANPAFENAGKWIAQPGG
ncbi:cell wall hydrolase [Novosphingobium sp. FKTRR1]|uniref:cell wall hydrolase n=1 Tax=Novosphingobium sp. FKTRR1 TaxID=2879118 RepID=UPI001CF012F4|nr:cell wall hydrolase [Novosphingobium sp. FKTRR1]